MMSQGEEHRATMGDSRRCEERSFLRGGRGEMPKLIYSTALSRLICFSMFVLMCSIQTKTKGWMCDDAGREGDLRRSTHDARQLATIVADVHMT